MGDSIQWTGPMMVWPKCPLEEPLTYTDIFFQSTIGLSGLSLMLLLFLIAWTAARSSRKQSFDRFMHMHNVAITLWPVLLFVHGSNGWIGVGFPLVVLAAGAPIICYSSDRVLRLLRYYCFGRTVAIQEAIVRPGPTGGVDGALTYIRISKPFGLWHFWPGTYAFICMPDHALMQWHPFTICSGAEDETVDFLIAGVGDWTQELARRALAVTAETELIASERRACLPKVRIDGPYAAPTVSALSQGVLVAVGAGVGITPFLSLMSTIVSHLSDLEGKEPTLQAAHLFWMSRSVDEYLFARQHFTKIVDSAHLRGRCFLHLHTTAKEPEKCSTAYLFREAVKRQNRVDKRAFDEAIQNKVHGAHLSRRHMIAGPQVPLAWLHGSSQDVLWLTDLLKDSADQIEVSGTASKLFNGMSDVARSPAAPWARAMLRGTTRCLQASQPLERTLPVVFGRPDFEKELQAIGAANPKHDVHTYICGNMAIVKSLKDICESLTQGGIRSTGSWHSPLKRSHQKFVVHFERFG